ncbi:Conserved hypothetical protein CHP01589 [Theobroma cacao]|nr:Conserved hypothetical protein CHP01589 [Theobroma cacao]
MYHKHQLPCLHCQPHDYIRMVQHMIERCLLFQMSRDDCVKALAKHAKIEPIITLTGKVLLLLSLAWSLIGPLKAWLLSEEEGIGVDSEQYDHQKRYE